MALPATDNFNRSEDPLSTLGWSTANGAGGGFRCTGSQCYRSNLGTSPHASVWDGDTFDSDHYAQVEIGNLSFENCGPSVRIQATGGLDAYQAGNRSTTALKIKRIDNGSVTQLGSIHTWSASTGDTLRVEASGSTLSVYLNDVLETTRTDSTYTGGYPGLTATGSSNYYDNFEADDLGGAAITAQYNNFLHAQIGN